MNPLRLAVLLEGYSYDLIRMSGEISAMSHAIRPFDRPLSESLEQLSDTIDEYESHLFDESQRLKSVVRNSQSRTDREESQ